jgi:hypothetical protein
MNLDDLLTAWADTQRLQPAVADRVLHNVTEPLPADWWLNQSRRMAQTIVTSTRMPAYFNRAA